MEYVEVLNLYWHKSTPVLLIATWENITIGPNEVQTELRLRLQFILNFREKKITTTQIRIWWSRSFVFIVYESIEISGQ